MEAQLTLVFETCSGMKETRVFTEQPMGIQFRSRMPISIKSIREGSQAEQLEVKLGWELHSIGGQLLEGMTIGEATGLLRESAATLLKCMVVRSAPLNATSVVDLAVKLKLKNVEEAEVVPYLKQFTINAQSAHSWEKGVEHPELRLGIINGHRKHGRCKHTWYVLVGKITAADASLTRQWQLERLLVHIRTLVHDPVKREMGNAYNLFFESSHFARHGGPQGTTARMGAWLAALSKAINVKALSPTLVVKILRFLEAPFLGFPETEPSLDAVVNAEGMPQQEDKEGETDEEEEQEESITQDVLANEILQGTADDAKALEQASSSSEAEGV